MKIGDLVKAKHVNKKNVGIVVQIDEINENIYVEGGTRYWVKFCGHNTGAFPFQIRQLEVLNESQSG